MGGSRKHSGTAVTVMLVGALWASQGQAQTAQAPAAPQAPALPHIVEDPYVGVFGFIGDDNEALVRRAEPLGNQTDWISEDDPMVARVKGEPDKGGNAFLKLTVGADGRVTDCQLQHGFGNPEPPQGLCERMPLRARFLPALDPEGQRVGDVFNLQVGYGRRARLATSPAPGRVVFYAAPSPAPPPPNNWPPMGRVSAVTVQGLDLLRGGGDAPEAHQTPFVGVEVQLDARGRVSTCNRVAGDEALSSHAEACALARRARYDISKETSAYRRNMRFHFVQQDGRLRALPQTRERWTQPTLTPESAQALTAVVDGAWPAMSVRVDPSGMPQRCRVVETSGDDARDAWSCRTIMASARFEPARDTLDRPTTSTFWRWRPVAPAT